MPEKNTAKDRLQKMGPGELGVYYINNIIKLLTFFEILCPMQSNTSLYLFLPQITTKSANLRHSP